MICVDTAALILSLMIFLCTPDDARPTQATEDFLSDLDSAVAQQIDTRFKEIMLKKKGGSFCVTLV